MSFGLFLTLDVCLTSQDPEIQPSLPPSLPTSLPPDAPVSLHPIVYAGQDVPTKLENLREKLQEKVCVLLPFLPPFLTRISVPHEHITHPSSVPPSFPPSLLPSTLSRLPLFFFLLWTKLPGSTISEEATWSSTQWCVPTAWSAKQKQSFLSTRRSSGRTFRRYACIPSLPLSLPPSLPVLHHFHSPLIPFPSLPPSLPQHLASAGVTVLPYVAVTTYLKEKLLPSLQAEEGTCSLPPSLPPSPIFFVSPFL